jgi:hypothetical protein
LIRRVESVPATSEPGHGSCDGHNLPFELAGADLLATSGSLRELGLRDGLTREIVEPTDGGDGTYQWDDVRLRRVRKFGSTIVWEVVRE